MRLVALIHDCAPLHDCAIYGLNCRMQEAYLIGTANASMDLPVSGAAVSTTTVKHPQTLLTDFLLEVRLLPLSVHHMNPMSNTNAYHLGCCSLQVGMK